MGSAKKCRKVMLKVIKTECRRDFLQNVAEQRSQPSGGYVRWTRVGTIHTLYCQRPNNASMFAQLNSAKWQRQLLLTVHASAAMSSSGCEKSTIVLGSFPMHNWQFMSEHLAWAQLETEKVKLAEQPMFTKKNESTRPSAKGGTVAALLSVSNMATLIFENNFLQLTVLFGKSVN
ncbi:unnamed protein product [Ceratitis capitata]|uniref:(Mediterranean fruit fly) hypothetical protein n=1 Tax=Ceratitis capitata TaxID=7213 RepID=A0A811UJH6_CERCA|nr:unnamed protein product [Ceratitis capitata]